MKRNGYTYLALRSARNRLVLSIKRLPAVHSTGNIHFLSTVAQDFQAGPFVFVGRGCTIGPQVTVGSYTMFAPNVSIVGDDHNWTAVGVPMQFAGRPAQQRTVVGSDVWLGQSAVVLRGITIGDGAIVAAGAVVTKDVPPYEIWGGVPARHIASRFSDIKDEQKHAKAINGQTAEAHFAEPLELTPLAIRSPFWRFLPSKFSQAWRLKEMNRRG